jgi:hypothetical protein
MEVDASDFACGAVLSQQDPTTGKWVPVAFTSHALDTTKQNYDVYDKELGAIMYSLRQWRHYILGHPTPIKIFCNHKNLQYYKDPQKLT